MTSPIESKKKKGKNHEKLFYIGGGSLLLLAALVCGAFFASPLLASAHSASTTSTTVTTKTVALTTAAKDKHSERAPLREFVRNHSDELVDRIAPQLHLSAAQLTDKLKSGERLVKIAKDQGISKDALRAILVQTTDASIAQALSNGKIDKARAATLTKLVQDYPFTVAHVLHRHYTKSSRYEVSIE